MIRALFAAGLGFLASVAGAQPPPKPDLVLTGTIDGSAHQTYRDVPFRVPAGVTAITVEFDHSGSAERTVIDLALADPERFRGASGGNKRRFTLSESYATPSYLPGPIVAGIWKLVLGVPNIRQGSRSDYTARITFERTGATPRGFAVVPLSSESRWYRGDFHAHSGHSDGSCTGQTGNRAPCPLYKTVEAAVARGLDFVTISEHNATSHHNAMLELQPYFDRLLMVPGRELTTFSGHANMFGATGFVDFRVGSKAVPDVDAMFRQAGALGALVSVNHPALPSGEVCMGCGWTARDTDWSRVHAIEVVNGSAVAAAGGAAETPLSGVAFWQKLLDRGHRLTAIGGSDNHDPASGGNAIGRPVTAVFARELSVPGLLDGVRSGRVFVDVEGGRDRVLEFSARAGGAVAAMGGTIAAGIGTLELTVRIAGVRGGRIELVRTGGIVVAGSEAPIASADETRTVAFATDGRAGWVRVNIRDAKGKLLLIGNPIYLMPGN